MKKSRFSEEQIVGDFEESEAGLGTADLCRKHGISTQFALALERDENRN